MYKTSVFKIIMNLLNKNTVHCRIFGDSLPYHHVETSVNDNVEICKWMILRNKITV